MSLGDPIPAPGTRFSASANRPVTASTPQPERDTEARCTCGHTFDRHLAGTVQPYRDPCAGGTPGFCGCIGYRPSAPSKPHTAAQEDPKFPCEFPCGWCGGDGEHSTHCPSWTPTPPADAPEQQDDEHTYEVRNLPDDAVGQATIWRDGHVWLRHLDWDDAELIARALASRRLTPEQQDEVEVAYADWYAEPRGYLDYWVAFAAGWQAASRRPAVAEPAGPWRVGRSYGIHAYEGNRPVATFHRPEDAKRAVAAVNAQLSKGGAQ